MAKTPARYAYRNKKNGNIFLISSELTSPDWELVNDYNKASNTDQTETDQESTEEAAQEAPEESKETDAAPAEKPEAASSAAKKKATTSAKKSTGKKV